MQTQQQMPQEQTRLERTAAAMPIQAPTDQTRAAQTPTGRSDDYVTIIASTFSAVMQRFQESGLAEQGYSIAGPVGRHQFAFSGETGNEAMFGGDRMIAATFFRAGQQQ